MTLSHLLATALQAELSAQYGLTLTEAESEALAESLFKAMGQIVKQARAGAQGEVIAWPWQGPQAPSRTEGGTSEKGSI